MSTFLRFLVEHEALPGSERYRGNIQAHLRRGEYQRRQVDPRLDAFVRWAADHALPQDGPARLGWLRARALLLALYCSGLRRAEAASVLVDDLFRAAGDGQIRIIGKGDKGRPVFFDQRAMDAALLYVRERQRRAIHSPYLFCSHGNRHSTRRERRLAPATVWHILHQLARQAEQESPAFLQLAERFSTHMTRHHFGQTLMDAGTDLAVIQELLGHASPDTTSRVYAKPVSAALLQAVRAAPGHRGSS